MKAFYGAKILLEGFEATEKANMNKLIEENGGEAAETFDTTVTHIVSLFKLLFLLDYFFYYAGVVQKDIIFIYILYCLAK